MTKREMLAELRRLPKDELLDTVWRLTVTLEESNKVNADLHAVCSARSTCIKDLTVEIVGLRGKLTQLEAGLTDTEVKPYRDGANRVSQMGDIW